MSETETPIDFELIEDPHTAIVNAMEMVRTGVAFQGAVLGKRITPTSFPNYVRVDLGAGKRMAIPTGFDEGQLEKTAHNLEQATMLFAVIAADSAMDDFYRLRGNSRRPLESGDPRNISALRGVDAVRALLYMIRCAFAHDPFNPKWEVRSEKRLGILVVEELQLSIDTSVLHGKHLHSAVWGGTKGLLDLLSILEQQTRPPAK